MHGGCSRSDSVEPRALNVREVVELRGEQSSKLDACFRTTEDPHALL